MRIRAGPVRLPELPNDFNNLMNIGCFLRGKSVICARPALRCALTTSSRCSLKIVLTAPPASPTAPIATSVINATSNAVLEQVLAFFVTGERLHEGKKLSIESSRMCTAFTVRFAARPHAVLLRGDLPRHGRPNRNGCATVRNRAVSSLQVVHLQRLAGGWREIGGSGRARARAPLVTFVSGAAIFVSPRDAPAAGRGRRLGRVRCIPAAFLRRTDPGAAAHGLRFMA